MAKSESEAEMKSKNSIRFGIIGCAEIAQKLARAISLAPHATLYAVGSRSLETAERFAALVGPTAGAVTKVYGSYEAVLDDPCVDAVYLPLPTSLHLRWAVAAARKKKHLLLEKPTALNAAELDQILEECRSNGVQFMDGSMWLHHPRTLKMKDFISDSLHFGQIHYIYSASTMGVIPEFLETNIRVKPDLDTLGALGDLAWYCIGAALWAKDYELPTAVQALPDTTRNSVGVILSCTASLHWGTTSTAMIHCSFVSHTSMDLAIKSSNASIHTNDFIIPYQEDCTGFELTRGANFLELYTGWDPRPEEVEVKTRLPQEAIMVEELARLARGIREFEHQPDDKWPEISRKTQLVLDAVKRSIDLGCERVQLRVTFE